MFQSYLENQIVVKLFTEKYDQQWKNEVIHFLLKIVGLGEGILQTITTKLLSFIRSHAV
jgi:hypothetical protein